MLSSDEASDDAADILRSVGSDDSASLLPVTDAGADITAVSTSSLTFVSDELSDKSTREMLPSSAAT